MPPVLLAELGSDPQKPTVCFYGHVDVQPARQEDGWLTDPYTLTEVDGQSRAHTGAGSSVDKGLFTGFASIRCAFCPRSYLPLRMNRCCSPGLRVGPMRLISFLFLSFVKETFVPGVNYSLGWESLGGKESSYLGHTFSF